MKQRRKEENQWKRILRLLALFPLLLCCSIHAVETLTFDASNTPNVTYRLGWGTNATTIGNLSLGTNTVAILTNGPWGIYFFQVWATSTNGVDSLPSNALLATNRPAAPLQLRIVPATNLVYLDISTDGFLTWQRFNDSVATRGARFYRGVTYPPLPSQ